MLDRLRRARIFTKLDLQNSYHLVRIIEGPQYSATFGTQYGHLEYQVMPFRLTNAPATLQAYIDYRWGPFSDHFAVCYLDYTLINSTKEEEHEEPVRKALEWRREFFL